MDAVCYMMGFAVTISSLCVFVSGLWLGIFSLALLFCVCNWPYGSCASTLIIKNAIELNWIIVITLAWLKAMRWRSRLQGLFGTSCNAVFSACECLVWNVEESIFAQSCQFEPKVYVNGGRVLSSMIEFGKHICLAIERGSIIPMNSPR